MWTGAVFTQPYLPSTEKLGYVKVPDYYTEASAWLNADPNYFRVLALPLVEGGITYDWQPYGYSGSATDYVLLPKPMIMDVHDPVSNNVMDTVSYYLDSGQTRTIWRLLSVLNVRYVMVHEDVNFIDRKTLDPAVVEAALNSTSIPYLNVNPVRDEYGHPIASSAQDWFITWGTRPGFIGNASTTTNDRYVDYTGHSSSDGFGYFGFGPTFTKPLNLSDARWLDMSIQSSVPGRLFIALTDENGRQAFFDGRTTSQYSLHSSNAWTNFTLPLNLPSYKNQNVDLGRIRSLLIAQVGLPSDVALDLKVKDVLVDRGAIESPVPGIHFSRRIGRLAFYTVGSTNSILYPTTSYSVLNESISVAEAVGSENYEPNHTLFVSSHIGNLSTLNGVGRTQSEVPLVSTSRTNPTTWVVKVRNSTAPFVLVFGQTFNPNWKLYFGGQSELGGFASPPIDDQLHYLANGFANAWYIDKTGDFLITIYFSPQSIVSIGMTVSLLTSLILLGCIFSTKVPILRRISKFQKLQCPKSKDLVGRTSL
jgi:hypothetical protein